MLPILHPTLHLQQGTDFSLGCLLFKEREVTSGANCEVHNPHLVPLSHRSLPLDYIMPLHTQDQHTSVTTEGLQDTDLSEEENVGIVGAIVTPDAIQRWS